MKLFFAFLLITKLCFSQNDSCQGNNPVIPAPPFCISFPYTDSATVCWEFVSSFDTIYFSFDAVVNCATIDRTYNLYDSACNLVASNITGMFPEVDVNSSYTICGLFICTGGGPGIRGVCQLEPLPVEWLYFTGAYQKEKKQVLLKWATVSEVNNDWFMVQKLADKWKNIWVDVTLVKGSGTSNVMHQYSGLDKFPSEYNWYRIKQVDYNGDSDYSQTIFVSAKGNPIDLNCIYFNMLGNYVGSGYGAINNLPAGIYIQKCEYSYKRFSKL